MNTDLFYNKSINKKDLKKIIHSSFQSYGIVTTTHLAEGLKKSGFHFATQAGISISIEDLKVPPTKDELFLKNHKDIKSAYYYEKRGNTNEIERFQKVIDTWHSTSEILKNQLVDYFKTMDPLNPVYMMAFSGARGNLSQVRQLVGMRGLMADPDGQIIDLPIKTNFREGLSITDYVISSYGARKGIVDTALRTADSGYLTRRLVDVAQHVIIRELDCQTKNGIRLLYSPGQSKIDQYLGRTLSRHIYVKGSKEILIHKNTTLTKKILNRIKEPVEIILRSPLTCEASRSICQKCYGWNLAQSQLVELADAVGVIAAQSIGEPGTQLTMRTFHTGGVFTGESNNQIRSVIDGQVLFSPKLETTISRTLYGEVILKAKNFSELFIYNEVEQILKRCLLTPETLIFVANKSHINKGDLLIESTLANKRTTTRIKNIFSSVSGEVQFQNILSNPPAKLAHNGLIWIASGQVYDIFPNMVIKKPQSQVIKNSAIAQSKITSRIRGVIKISPNNFNYILHCPLIIAGQNLYRNKDGNLFSVGKKNQVFLLSKGHNENSSEWDKLAERKTNHYTLSNPARIYYSRVPVRKNGKIDCACILISQQLKISANLTTTQKIENNPSNLEFDQQIIYPGEIIGACEVKVLSYCQVEETDTDSLKLTIIPLQQWIIPKPKPFSSKMALPFFTNDFTNGKYLTTTFLLVKNGGNLKGNQSFIKTSLQFSNASKNLIQPPVLKVFSSANENSKKLAFFQLLKLPTNLVGIAQTQINVTYLTGHNQYIYPYSVIGTLNCISTKNILIKNLKNSKNKPNRFLISTNSNYKTYKLNVNERNENSKFIVVGDKIGKNKITNYSGYKIAPPDKDKCKIRISSPFFISPGTRLFVKHGTLVQQNESLFQFIYTRIVSSDIVTGLPRIEQLLESRLAKNACQLIQRPGVVKQQNQHAITILEKCETRIYDIDPSLTILLNKGELVEVAQPIDTRLIDPHNVLSLYFKYYCSLYSFENAAKRSILNSQILLVNLIQDVYKSQGIYISNKHVEVIIRQITSKVKISELKTDASFEVGEFLEFEQARYINMALKSTNKPLMEYTPVLLGITKVSLLTESFISSASFQETTRVLTKAAIEGKVEWLRGLKENVILGRLVPAGTGFQAFNSLSLLNVKLS